LTQSVFGRLRRFWLDVHLWIGVGLFLLLVPIGISGAMLVWHDPLDELIHPHRFEVSDGGKTLPASAYLASARTALGARATVSQIRLPEDAGNPVIVSARINGQTLAPGERPQSLTVWMDPGTAKVLDVANTRNEVINIMHRLHGSLLITTPGLGRKIVGWMGWAMTVSCLTGLWLWWPRNGQVARGLRWRRSPSTMNNLHHLFGFWVLIPLLAVSLTGVYISFPATSRALFGVAEWQKGPRPTRPVPPPPLAEPATPIDVVVAAATAEKPGLTLASVSLPTEGRRASWRVQFAPVGDGEPETVQIGDKDGKPRKAREPGAGSGAPTRPDALSPLMRKIHDGQDTPFIWQLLVFLTGVAPPLLGVTGTVMWLRRRARRRHLAALKGSPAE
jgi:uncharacterized iron-regulated membrane protein